MDALEPTTIGLPADLKVRLAETAARAGRPLDDVIRDVLERAVKHQPLRFPPQPIDDPSRLELAEVIDQIYPGSGWSGAD